MATRKNTFLLKRSNVAGNIPTAGQILLGELALNTADVKLYASGTTTNSILPIGWDRVSRTGDTMTGTLYAPSISATTIISPNEISGATFFSTQSIGDEGGEIKLNRPVTNSSISGTVTIDVWQNRLRIFEAGGTNRGGYYDITALASGVGTNLLNTGGGSGVTAFTYNNANTFTINNSISATINTVTGFTVNGNLSAATIDQVNYIDFNTGATATNDAGRIKWNDIDGTYDMGLYQGVSLQVGQEQNVYGKASSAITNGDVVMYNGVQGDHILFAKADPALISGNSFNIIGIATQDFITNQFGYITTIGKVRDLNTIAYSAGTILYFNSTGTTTGGLTNVEPPAPYDNTVMATVIKSHATQGILFVRPQFRFPMDSLEDVQITNIQNNDILQYSGSAGYYVNTNNPKFTSVSATTMSAGTFTGNLTGLASLATSATTALNASNANSSSNVYITDDASSNIDYYLTFVKNTNQQTNLLTDAARLTYNPSTDTLKTTNGTFTSLIQTTNILATGTISATTMSAATIFARTGLSATTVSATTYLNLPTDIRVTGGTYSTGIATFTNNTGGTFNVTGFNTGTVTSVAALTLGTSGTDLSSTVANGTTTPVITLNVPNASTTARGVVTTGSQTFGGVKTFTDTVQVTSTTGPSIGFDVTGTSVGGIVVNPSYFQFSAQANQGYLFKNYTGNNLLFLTANGGAQFSSSVTAGSFIKTGGTATQFLKADGSVDSTTYVPTARTLTINGTAFDLSADRSWTITSGGFTGGTITGPTIFTGGVTANTISATTVIANNFTGLASLATSATTALDSTNAANIFTSNLPTTDILAYPTFVTGFGSNRNLYADSSTLTYNPSSNILTLVNVVATGTITATTISATTYQNLPTDIRVTGGTYATGTATFRNNTGGTFTVTGFNTGTVTSVAALTLGTSGTDLNSTVANGTTTPVITLNVPDASATARGVITTTTQTIAGIKTFTGTLNGAVGSFSQSSAGDTLTGYNGGTGGNGINGGAGNGIGGYFVNNSTTYPTVRLLGLSNTRLLEGRNTSDVATFSVTSTGVISGSSFNRIGGTSAQFLKADGSVDSTAYVPTSRTLTINGTTFDLSANRSWTITSGAFTGGTVTGPTVFTGGVTANTLSATTVIANNFTGLASLATSATTALNATNATSATTALNATNATNATSATTALNATNVGVTNNTTTNATYYLGFVSGTTGNQALNVDSSALTFNPSTNTLTVANLSGLASLATSATTALSATNANIANNAPVSGTYSSGTLTLTNLTGGTFNVTGFSTGGGGTFTGGTVTGPTIFTAGLTANTISATTITAGTITASNITGIGGLQNYVAKFTSNGSFLGNSQIFDNGTSVGIGMTSPSATAKLDIAGIIRTEFAADPTTGATTAKFLSYSPSPYGLLFRGYSSGAHSIQSQREANNAQVYPLVFQPLGGFVGIGTLTPSKLLDVNGDALINGLTVGLGTGSMNNAVLGNQALASNTSGYNNVAIHSSLPLNTTGTNNVGIGYKSLFVNTTGNNNVSVGTGSLQLNTTGTSNVSVGTGALFSNDSGGANIAIGEEALYTNVNGGSNVAIGYRALYVNTQGSNLALGYYAAGTLDGSGNNIIGVSNNQIPDGNSLSNQNKTLSISKNTEFAKGMPHFWAPDSLKVFPGTAYILEADPNSYSAVFIDYSLEDQSGNLRAGTLKGIFDITLATIKWDEVTTADIGSTANYTFNFIDNGSTILGVELTNSGSVAVFCNLTSRLISRSIV